MFNFKVICVKFQKLSKLTMVMSFGSQFWEKSKERLEINFYKKLPCEKSKERFKI